MNRYSEEYKREAVQLVIARGMQNKRVARELGINSWTLKDWVDKYKDSINAERVRNKQVTPEEENKLLRKELAGIREERDILKKAIAVFSQKPKRSIDL
jgi:transposase